MNKIFGKSWHEETMPAFCTTADPGHRGEVKIIKKVNLQEFSSTIIMLSNGSSKEKLLHLFAFYDHEKFN